MRRKPIRQRSMSAYEFATDNDVITSAAPPEKVVQELRDLITKSEVLMK